MRAIETRYKGYRFRSRLEARWAVFFDNMGIKYEYEPEGFVLAGGTHYLPDFRVTTPQGRTIWYEVKANDDSSGVDKAEKFDSMFKEDDPTECHLLIGDPYEFLSREHIGLCPRCGMISRPAFDYQFEYGDPHYGCWPCDAETPCGGGHPYEDTPWGAEVTPHKGMVLITPETLPRYLRKIKNAATAAREARFEHGQTPS